MKRRSFLGFLLGAPVALKCVAAAAAAATPPSAEGMAVNVELMVDNSGLITGIRCQIDDLQRRLGEDLDALAREASVRQLK
jgi:hypothetical protein